MNTIIKVKNKLIEFNNKNKTKKKIVLPESKDERIIEAANILNGEGIIKVILLGNEDEIKKEFQKNNWKIEGIEIVDPETNNLKEEYASRYYELRKHKGATIEYAKNQLKDFSTFGVMMVESGHADGMVAGATWPTAQTIRPALQIIKTKPELPVASSYFIMETMDKEFFFADCAFIKNPDFEELAYITIETTNSAKQFGIEPKVALLSFSTKGSGGEDESIKKIRKATKLAKKIMPELKIEGEVQLDTAISPEVNKLKCPDCTVKGDANVLIFPDLNSGNIGYKLVQRFANAKAIGPIIQGLKKPVNDLSRGCSANEIIDVAYITALETIEK